MLQALTASDFVEPYVPFGMSRRVVKYRLVDPFCAFYLHFVAGNSHEQGYWLKRVQAPNVVSWRGIAFEQICRNHVLAIKRALGIEGVAPRQSSLIIAGDGESEGTQIDLLVERADNIVNMCEMKFYGDEFTVDKPYYLKLCKREQALRQCVKKRVAVHSTLVTTFGLTYNEYSGIFQQVVTLDDLFA